MSQAKRNEDAEITPQYTHRKRLIEEEEERNKETVVKEEYYEIISDHQHKKGGKVRHCIRTTSSKRNGTMLHRIYLGRYKDLKDHLDRLAKEGKKIIR